MKTINKFKIDVFERGESFVKFEIVIFIISE